MDLNERMIAVLDRLADSEATRDERIAQMIGTAIERILPVVQTTAIPAPTDPVTPSATTHRAGPLDRISDRFDMLKYSRSDFEIAMMIFDGARKLHNPIELAVPEDLKRGWQYHVFETGSPPQVVNESTGKHIRAMDAQESGFGLQLVGAQYVRELWEAARNRDTLVGLIREIPMTDPTVYVPINGAIPEMLFVGESTGPTATAYTTSKTASNRAQLDAKKFTINQIWSGELNEDSIVTFAPFLRAMLSESTAQHLGSAYYNGDTVTAATGNVSQDDATPGATKHYLAWDGIRKYWIVTNTANGKDAGNSALNPVDIDRARGKLNAGDDDIDNAINNINWGTDPSQLVIVADFDTYMNMLSLDEVITVDKYGPGATVITGELGRYKGIPVIAPAYASKTLSNGKASTTEASNTRGQITVLNPQAWLAGVRRDVALYFDRIQRTDQFLFELYTRRAFTRFGANVSAGIYNIAVS